jgi:PTS system ascorbate-specific IIB component
MYKVVAACGNGLGSSQIIKMKIEKVFKKLGIPAAIDHMSIGEAKNTENNYDILFCSIGLTSSFSNLRNKETKIIGLQNLLSETEIEEKLIENGIK